MKLALLVCVLAACGPGSAGGPTMTGRLQDQGEAVPDIQSNDILAREPVTNRAKVKHILVSSVAEAKAFGGNQSAKGRKRSREDAEALAKSLLEQVRGGADIDALMRQWSEDPATAETASPYEVKPDSAYVFEFKRLSLRLNVGEAGLVKTMYGWHIVKRIE